MQKVNVKLYNITDRHRLTNFCPKRYNMRSMMKTYETEYGIGKPGVSQGRKAWSL